MLGVFLSLMVIKQISLMHKGGAYHYRLHNQKLNSLSLNYPSLVWYLNKVFEKCPDNYFFNGPRSSMLKFNLSNLNMHQIIGHEISDLCNTGLKVNKERYKTGHSKVQVFMLENDDKTVGVEVPIWMKRDEIDNFDSMFNSEEPLTGHIDILRIENGNIWIWDYKPKSFDEKYAATQVFFYSLMLSKRTLIPLSKFRCGYFDEKYAFIFKPELKNLIKERLL
jgi:hypothetical protein